MFLTIYLTSISSPVEKLVVLLLTSTPLLLTFFYDDWFNTRAFLGLLSSNDLGFPGSYLNAKSEPLISLHHLLSLDL